MPSTSSAPPIPHIVEEEEEDSLSDNSMPEEFSMESGSSLDVPQRNKDQQTQTISNVSVEIENEQLKKELEEKNEIIKHLQTQFSYEHIREKDKLILLYTGLPTGRIFGYLDNLLGKIEINYYLKWRVERISRTDQLLMTLMKLRHNFPHEDLAVRFNISQATVTNIVITHIHLLHETLFKQLMTKIPSRKKNLSCLPNCFGAFTNCRIILDCTELYTAIPRQSMSKQKQTYSSYKHRNTWKGLVGVAPNGVITYVSELYAGATSDKKIVEHCGILKELEPGDLILADKGFLIKDLLPAGVSLNIPPFLSTPQFTEEQVLRTETIARARIHVERAIQRMKVFNILSLVPETLIPYTTIIFQAVAALTNLQYPLIREVEQYYCNE